MIEKEYETASQTYVRIRNNLLPNNEGAEWLADSGAWEIVDELFTNKDKLKDSINSALNFVKEHNKQTPFGPAMFDKQDYILPVDGMSKDEQKGFVNGLKSVLRILEE